MPDEYAVIFKCKKNILKIHYNCKCIMPICWMSYEKFIT